MSLSNVIAFVNTPFLCLKYRQRFKYFPKCPHPGSLPCPHLSWIFQIALKVLNSFDYSAKSFTKCEQNSLINVATNRALNVFGVKCIQGHLKLAGRTPENQKSTTVSSL